MEWSDDAEDVDLRTEEVLELCHGEDVGQEQESKILLNGRLKVGRNRRELVWSTVLKWWYMIGTLVLPDSPVHGDDV